MVKRLLLSISLLSVLLLPALPVPSASAFDPFGGVCGQSGTGKSAVCTDTNNKCTPNSATDDSNCNPISGSNGLLIKITHIVAFIAGAAAVLLIIVGGLRFITSGGNSEKVSSARSTVINSLIGLVVIVLAASLITYVVEKL